MFMNNWFAWIFHKLTNKVVLKPRNYLFAPSNDYWYENVVNEDCIHNGAKAFTKSHLTSVNWLIVFLFKFTYIKLHSNLYTCHLLRIHKKNSSFVQNSKHHCPSFWLRFYIVVLGIGFFPRSFTFHILFWLLFPFSIWTFISPFFFYFFLFFIIL